MRMHREHRAAWDRPSGSAEIAAAIRAARERAGKSQFTLGAIVGVSQQAVQQYERGKRTPSAEVWTQLELTLGPLGVVREADPGPGAQDAAEGKPRAA
jgi:ribosome-binding protein aMBF1 (putative translation factor)